MVTEAPFTIPSGSDYKLAELVEQGMPTDSLALLKEQGLTFTEIAELVIAPRTLKHRKARGENLSLTETDRLVRVLRVLKHADHTFGSHEKALMWLRMEDDRIGNRTVLSLLASEAGGRIADEMLYQIEDGVFS